MPIKERKINFESIIAFLNSAKKTNCISYIVVNSSNHTKTTEIENILKNKQISSLKFVTNSKIYFWFNDICENIKLHLVFQLSNQDFKEFTVFNIQEVLTMTNQEFENASHCDKYDDLILYFYNVLRELVRNSISITKTIY